MSTQPKKLSIKLNKDVHKEFKLHAVIKNKYMCQIVNELIEKYCSNDYELSDFLYEKKGLNIYLTKGVYERFKKRRDDDRLAQENSAITFQNIGETLIKKYIGFEGKDNANLKRVFPKSEKKAKTFKDETKSKILMLGNKDLNHFHKDINKKRISPVKIRLNNSTHNTVKKIIEEKQEKQEKKEKRDKRKNVENFMSKAKNPITLNTEIETLIWLYSTEIINLSYDKFKKKNSSFIIDEKNNTKFRNKIKKENRTIQRVGELLIKKYLEDEIQNNYQTNPRKR